jgi:hypothetical protein
MSAECVTVRYRAKLGAWLASTIAKVVYAGNHVVSPADKAAEGTRTSLREIRRTLTAMVRIDDDAR